MVSLFWEWTYLAEDTFWPWLKVHCTVYLMWRCLRPSHDPPVAVAASFSLLLATHLPLAGPRSIHRGAHRPQRSELLRLDLGAHPVADRDHGAVTALNESLSYGKN